VYSSPGLAVFAADCVAQERAADDEPGFKSLFNGKDLQVGRATRNSGRSRRGDHRQTTAENPTQGNTFLIWRDGTVETSNFGSPIEL